MKMFYQHPRYEWWVEIEEKDGKTFAKVLPCLIEGSEFEIGPYELGKEDGLDIETYVNLMHNQGLERVLILP